MGHTPCSAAVVHLYHASRPLFLNTIMRDRIIALILGIIMLLNLVDVITDIGLGVPLWHIMQETGIVLISALTCLYMIYEMRLRSREVHRLKRHLSQADEDLVNLSSAIAQARQRYGEAIQREFDQWNLTLSEQQVAMLLLKGLSFREIADVRDTREKTVRQQASAIYAKSGLEGRHAFSAWFLEDFLADSAVHPRGETRQAA